MDFIVKRDSSDDELQHHGILGQKWGIRRYQNFDGSYTKKGLERYNKSKEKYDELDKEYRELKDSGKDYKDVKNERRIAKKQLKKDYKQLALDKKADQGKELYKQGNTIETIETKAKLASYGVSAGALAVGAGLQFLQATKDLPIPAIVPYAAYASGSAAIAIIKANAFMKANKLRAYYGH